MIVNAPARSVRPRCHNAPAMEAERVLHGIDRETGFLAVVVLSNSWASTGCKTWLGVGIGQPTEEFPSGTPYPMAHGFDCRGCARLPPEFERFA